MSGAVVHESGEGPVAWLGGFPHRTRLAGEETDGTICVVECEAPRDSATPWHVHHRDDETFYVVAGEMAFHMEGDTTRAGAGTVVHLRRGVPHSFTVESERARFLVIGTPAIQDVFFQAAGAPTQDGETGDFGRMAQIAIEYGVEILGPPPRSGTAAGAEGAAALRELSR